ncbi:hypothetical protein Pcinc_023639 [Petrolisthes cinctipes]|uniref:Uncharacterized protein n=1 Tax=Petrolisthes cinctipes TaxID=88211 RepID=A0AAE1FD60_PETCI|nr:hypothetical protein Pcinc_023639 [Petrolisthes cinctipes]
MADEWTLPRHRDIYHSTTTKKDVPYAWCSVFLLLSHCQHLATLSLSFPPSGLYLLTMAEDFLRDMAAREYSQDDGTNNNRELERYLQAHDADGSGTPPMLGVGFGSRQRGVPGMWDNNNSQPHHQPSTITPAAAAAEQNERYDEHYYLYQQQHQQYQHQSRQTSNNNGDDFNRYQHQQREHHQRDASRRGRRGFRRMEQGSGRGSGGGGGSGGAQNPSRDIVIEYVTSIYELEEGSDTARLVTSVYRPREPERIPQHQHQRHQDQNQHHRGPSVSERGRDSFSQMFNLDPPRTEGEDERNEHCGWLGSQK